MIDTIKTLWNNLEKWQKIVTIILFQGVLIILFVITINSFMGEKSHIKPIDESNQTSVIPEEAKVKYEKALWELISSNTEGLNKNVIKDAVIREGSYTEEINTDTGTISARFIVDIDSIEQTYVVYTGWTADHATFPDPVIDCPTLEETKYTGPNSICKGTYRDKTSPSLYLPYKKTAPRDKEANNIFIDWDDSTNTIFVQLVACRDFETLKKEAMDYLNSTPINLSKYNIVYDSSSLDANCKE